MTTTSTALNEGQRLIFSRNNILRAFPDFDDTGFAGTHLNDNQVIVTRNDGTTQSYPIDKIITAFKEFTARTPDFFSYLGPNYRGPSIWRNNCYVMFKGWAYQSQGSSKLPEAIMQKRWADKFSMLDMEDKVTAALNQFNLGYLVSPDGKFVGRQELKMADDQSEDQEPEAAKPYCSCGSFQQQSRLIDQIQEVIPGYEPICKHISWFKSYRQLLSKRSNLIQSCRGHVASKVTAWNYIPPETGQPNGKFQVIWTKDGEMATLDRWRHYKPEENYTQHDVWTLFDAMLENGFVPFPLTSLPHISHAFK